MLLHLTPEQGDRILRAFHETDGTRAAHAWTKRSYAPMHVHRPWMQSLRDQLRRHFPDHVPTFDVVFSVPAGKAVAWHCDYESIGPFEVDRPWQALRDAHFVTVHFNLTPCGGALHTLPWTLLSYVHYRTIVCVGIYHWVHALLNRVCAPLFDARGGPVRHHTPQPLVGNCFNNLALHAVAAGDAPRTSYVVRLARRDAVRLTPESVQGCRARSDACEHLTRVIEPHVQAPSTPVESVPWSEL